MWKQLEKWTTHRNKQWRKCRLRQKYITRLKERAPFWQLDKEQRLAVSWTEMYNAENTFKLKSMSTTCSCPMCRGERYNRRKFKEETRLEIEMF